MMPAGALLNFALIGKQSLYLASNFVCTSKTESGWKGNFRNYREYSSLSILIAVGTFWLIPFLHDLCQSLRDPQLNVLALCCPPLALRLSHQNMGKMN